MLVKSIIYFSFAIARINDSDSEDLGLILHVNG